MRTALTSSTRRFLAVSVLMYLFSLVSSAFVYDGGKATGAEALMLGWFAAIFGVLELISGEHLGYVGTIAWVANLFMVATCVGIFNRRRKVSIILSIVTLCFSSLFFMIKHIDAPDGHMMANVRAGGGTFLWIGSFFFGWLAAVSLEPVAKERKADAAQ